MPTPSTGSGDFRNKEANLGGADAVGKTSYGSGSGTEPEGRQPAEDGEKVVTASVGSGGGLRIGGIALIAIVIALVAFFGFAFFR
ncbi:MAG: hypothetical protein ACR2G6_16385 [Gemmatimonadaceae bacterium]